MTPNEYQQLAQRTECDHDRALSRINLHHHGGGGWPSQMSTRLLHSVIGMMGELGELAGALEKWLWYGQPFDAVNFKEEIGDTNWYQAEAMNALEAKFEEILRKNIEKLQKRYPDKYSDEKALNRDLETERSVLERVYVTGVDPGMPDPPIEGGYTGVGASIGHAMADSINLVTRKLHDEAAQARGNSSPVKFDSPSQVNQSGFLEPPEESETRSEYPGWTYGRPTLPGNYEWFYSHEPFEYHVFKDYTGIPHQWGQETYYRKLN